MKKSRIVAIVIALLLILTCSLTACGEKTLTLDFNSGAATATGSTSSVKEKLEKNADSVEITLPSNNFKNSGYTFVGWKIGEEVYQAGEKVEIAEATTATAQWMVSTEAVAVANETRPLVLATSELDGVFNPFFYSSAYDADVLGMIYSSMLITNPKGELVAGDDYPTIAKEYKVDVNEANGEAVYTFVIKNGLKFSDGSAVTVDDVLFNYYVYLDPAYIGSATMYTLPIKGLKEYRYQDPNAQVSLALADKIMNSTSYVAGQGYTEAQYNVFYNTLNTEGVKMATDIKNYVNGNAAYTVQKYTDRIGKTPAEIAASPALQWAFGMNMWGFGGISDKDATKFEAENGKEYALSSLSAEIYWEVIKDCYTDDDGIISSSLDDENAGGAMPYETATTALMNALKVVGSEPVETIAGLAKGTKTISGTSYDTVVITCTEQSPKTILQLGATIAPKNYYTQGYTYQTGSIRNFGCELGYKNNDVDGTFMKHLKTKNAVPMGSGPYKMGKGPANGFFEDDSIVYFERNTNFDTFGLGNAKIKYVNMKVISLGQELDSVKAREVHYSSPSATPAVMNEIATIDNITDILVDNLGYGYICVNPKYFPNVNERIALNTLFNLELVKNYYPNGLADVIYRSMSQVSWAYPEGSKITYDFDSTGAIALEYFKKAGYTQAGGKLLKPDGTQLKVTMTIPSAASEHPAGSIFLAAKDILEKLGAVAEVAVDAKLITNIKGETGIAIYALAWNAALDPDMYQTTHYASQADSVIANGIKWLYENTAGASLDNGTVEWKGKTLTQKQALKELGDLIEEALKYMSPEERSPIYADALELFAKLAIEIPTYQRKNLVVYDNKVIDAASLSKEVTPYWSAIAEIWNVSFVADYVVG